MKLVKRLIALLICVISLIQLASCMVPNKKNEVDNETGNVTIDIAAAKQQFSSIECREPPSYKKVQLSYKNDSAVLQITVPDEWELETDSSGNTFFSRDGLKIGNVVSGTNNFEQMTSVFSDKCNVDDVKAEYDVKVFADKDGNHFRRVFTYEYKVDDKTNTIGIDVDFAELNDYGQKKLYYDIIRKDVETKSDIEKLDLGKINENTNKDILILGNSFINSSDIGETLTAMINSSQYSNAFFIYDVSIGYATVNKYVDTYSSYISDIKNGLYDAVYMCGFYSSADVASFTSLFNACNIAGVKLVIFPAHNENAASIESVRQKYDDVAFVDWKGEIDRLIKSGVPRSEFCIDDAHQHSKPLAGYVGAHMIYRSLTGEIPPSIKSTNSIPQSEVNRQLGEYPSTGITGKLDVSNVYFLD